MSLFDELIRIGNKNPDLQDEIRYILSHFEKESISLKSEFGRKLFSQNAYRDLRKGLGKRITPFLRFYLSLRPIYEGAMDPPEEGFYRKWRDLVKIPLRRVDGDETKSLVKSLAKDAGRIFKRLDRLEDPSKANSRSKMIYKRLLPIFGDIIPKIGRDQDVYLIKEKLRMPGWIRFELMPPKEKKLEKLKERDEELYELAKDKDRLEQKLKEKKEKEIHQAGLTPNKRPIADTVAMTGEEVQGDKAGRGKKRGDDVWMLNEDLSRELNLNELDGSAIELELELDGQKFRVKDFRFERGNWYLKTTKDIEKEWGNCKLRQKEVWVYDDDGDILTTDEFEEKRKERKESMDKLSRVMPDDVELGELRTFGTTTTGKGRRGNVSDHGLGQDTWVLVDKDPDFNPESVLDSPDGQLMLHLDDTDIPVSGWDIQPESEVAEINNPNLETRAYVYLEFDRPIDEKKYGQYQLQEQANIIDEYAREQEIEYRTLSDDPDKRQAMTRVYPCVEIQGETVIAEGRYKGVILDDMVNASGRMVEGTAYDYDPEQGRPMAFAEVPDKELREPYISVNDDGDLYLKVPSRDNYTDLRNKVDSLSGKITGMEKIEGTRQSRFIFEPKHFRPIRDTVKSVAMSKAAKDKIKEYYDQMKKEQNKFSKENLRRYDGERLGGFIEGFDFRDKQKEALAWLDGENGLVGADTGTGKCVSPDTLVDTNKGTVRIEDLNPGIDTPDSTAPINDDWKVHVDGEYLPVKRFYYGGEKPTNIVTTSKGFEVEATKVHPLLKADESGLSWTETRNLEEGDYVAIHRNDKGEGFPDNNPEMEIPDIDNMHFHVEKHEVPSKMSPDLGRLFGYIIGEGWTNSDMRIDVSQCPDKNPKMHDDISCLLTSYLKSANPSTRGQKDLSISSKFVREYLKLNGIQKSKSREKTIPWTVLEGTKETVKEFLKALFSSEGHVSGRGCFEFYTASEELGKQVQTLLLKFGIIGSRMEKIVDDGIYYRLLVSGDDAQKLKDRIGFIREDQKKAFDSANIGDSVNHDLIPHEFASNLASKIKRSIEKSVDVGLSNPSSGVSTSLRTTMSNTIHQGRGLSYSKLDQLVKLYDRLVDRENYSSEFRSLLDKILERDIYFDKIAGVEESIDVVMDIEVDHPSHTFVGNGLYNHNTLVALGYIRDLEREGVLDSPGSKVLFLHPASLRGNLESEAESFLKNPDETLEKVDTMTYGELSSLDVEREVANKTEEGKSVIVGDDVDFIQQYDAVVCDEASYLKSRTSDRSLLIQQEHPRKVLLSASPMEKDPKELYHLAAISNNWDLQNYEGMKERRKFQKRFSEKIGSKVVGVTENPIDKQDLVDWINVNMFQIDKTQMDDVDLPSLDREAVNVPMPDEVEERYREITGRIEELTRDMVKVFKEKDEDAYDSEVTGAVVQLGGLFAQLEGLQNRPEEALEEVEDNPKLSRSLEHIKNDVESSSRALLWTDSADFARRAAEYFSKNLPGTKHAFGTTDEIEVYKNGEVVESYSKRVYNSSEGYGVPEGEGERVEPGQWRTFVAEEIIQPLESGVVTFTATQSYSKGFNLQAFSKVIHLDRDDWNAEDMKQRTARSWRQGQDEKVEEYTMDMTYSEREDEYDRTLDEIKKYFQEMEEELFQQFIKETQKQTPGKAWFGMKKEPAELYDVERDLVELMASPYIENHAEIKKKLKRAEKNQ